MRLGRWRSRATLELAGALRGHQVDHKPAQTAHCGGPKDRGQCADDKPLRDEGSNADRLQAQPAASSSSRAAMGRTACSSTQSEARSRWLTACWLMPRCLATSSCVRPPRCCSASTTAQPALERRTVRDPSRVSTASQSSPRSGTAPVMASGTGRVRLFARVTASRARTKPCCIFNKLLSLLIEGSTR